MSGAKRHLRGRMLLMDDVDEAMFSMALKDEFPTVIFDQGGGQPYERKALKTYLRIGPQDTPYGGVFNVWVPELGWKPKFGADNFGRGFSLLNPPKIVFFMDRSIWYWTGGPRWAFDAPTLEYGQLSANYSDDDEEEKAFVRTLFRILNRLTTNRFKVENPRRGIVYSHDTKGCQYWGGHHALEWCAQTPFRMLEGRYRPRDDWAVPTDAWYQDLRERCQSLLDRPIDAYLDDPITPDN